MPMKAIIAPPIINIILLPMTEGIGKSGGIIFHPHMKGFGILHTMTVMAVGSMDSGSI